MEVSYSSQKLKKRSLQNRIQGAQLQLDMTKDYFKYFPTQLHLLKIRQLKTHIQWLEWKLNKELMKP